MLMKKLYFTILSMLLVAVAPANAQVDYTPVNNGERTYSMYNMTRSIQKLQLDRAGSYEDFVLDATMKSQDYLDATELCTFHVDPSETVEMQVVINNNDNQWTHHYIYIDADANGFTAAIADDSDYEPAGDLVAYSVYNTSYYGGDGPNEGVNSAGERVTNLNVPYIPSFEAPAEPGLYRLRVKQDWCNIDPSGSASTFKSNGGQIIDIMLQVGDVTSVDVVVADAENVIYDLCGRRVDEITVAGIYIVNGKKVLFAE